MEYRSFSGPLFLVGMPRSGTKLLRAMLHRHPRIRFAQIETEFFPYWVARWEDLGALEGREGFEGFYEFCLRLPFFVQYAERGVKIASDDWFRASREYTPAAVFEALMRCVLKIPNSDSTTIWGDKSPSYLRHVPLLMNQFPQARVIHIIRDVRDCCLSARKAWGKNMLRVAQRWNDDVSRCRADARDIQASYHEVRYEDLLADSTKVLKGICNFVDVDFDEAMLSPGANTENLGDARGVSTVLSSNMNKYRSKMSPEMVLKIEKIACATLRSLEYPCDYRGDAVRLPNWRMRSLQLADAYGLLRTIKTKRGWVGGARFLLEDFRVSGNRDSFLRTGRK